jgi:hypothetical protein
MPVRRVFACLVIAVATAIGFSTTTLASAGAAYKIEFSNNCNNPTFCFDPTVNPSVSLGGDWGSIRLNSDGTGTAEFTSATHQTPGVPNGAVHFSLVLVWNPLSSPTAPPPGAVTADPNGKYLVITVVNIPSLGYLITPATPGHYSFQGAMFRMPGVNYMLQINAI